jgi:hypothetical protein
MVPLFSITYKHMRNACKLFSLVFSLARVFTKRASLEKIINKTAYCKSVTAHPRSSPFLFVLVNEILGEDLVFSNTYN